MLPAADTAVAAVLAVVRPAVNWAAAQQLRAWAALALAPAWRPLTWASGVCSRQ